MKRDAEATRKRILDAATAEFAEYGIAGARVDRIAREAGSNKAMIYAYFTSKELLFDAVFDAIVVRTMRDVPMNADDLPDYSARLFDQNQRYPEAVRLGRWDHLERCGAGMTAAAVAAASQSKIDAISRAQAEGSVSSHFSARTLLEFIIALTQIQAGTADGPESPEAVKARRQAVKDAVTLLTRT